MIRYVVSRLVVSVIMVLLATLVIFLIANTVPGDPVLTALGDMAARLQGQSEGGDIVLSVAVADDPAVRPLIAALPAREESVALKGFASPIRFVRLLPS